LVEKMPNGGTKTHAGDGLAIAPDDKALNEKGLNGKPGWEDAVRRNKILNVRRLQQKPWSTRHLTRKTDNKQKDREKMIVTCNSL
jgi:hypothetical protein